MSWFLVLWTAMIPTEPLILPGNAGWVFGVALLVTALGLWWERERVQESAAAVDTKESRDAVGGGPVECPA